MWTSITSSPSFGFLGLEVAALLVRRLAALNDTIALGVAPALGQGHLVMNHCPVALLGLALPDGLSAGIVPDCPLLAPFRTFSQPLLGVVALALSSHTA